jgi:hypothetical protein
MRAHPVLIGARMNRTAMIPAFLALVALGCGGSTATMGEDGGTEGGGGGVSADQAASDAAHAYCQRAEACAPAYVSIGFGDVRTCEQRLRQELLPVFGANGSSSTPAQTESCAQAIPQMTCADLLARKNATPCQTLPGMLADGAACGADSQCHGTRCRVAADALCGTCTEPAPAGAACGVDADCQPGMTCLDGSCTQYGNEGASCSTTQPCRPDLGCVGGTCGAPSPAGTACKATAECDLMHGYACHPVSMTCQPFTFAPANGTCGLVNNALVLCSGPGSLCKGAQAPSYQGTCVPFAMDGAGCDADAGPLCEVGAVCSGGTCQVPNPANCH